MECYGVSYNQGLYKKYECGTVLHCSSWFREVFDVMKVAGMSETTYGADGPPNHN